MCHILETFIYIVSILLIMVEVRISFPEELKEKIEEHPEINWSLVFRRAAAKLLHKLALIEFLETRINKSEFTEQDVEELSDKIKQERLKELKSQGIL